MKKITLIIFLSGIIGMNAVDAQIFTQAIDEQELQFKVKLIDEFFRRFNYETDYKGDPIVANTDSVSNDSVMKRKNLVTLLNLDTFADKNGVLDSVSTAFLNYVIANDKQIHYTDTTWNAEAISSFSMNGKTYPARIFLRTEQVEDVIYKWVITDIETPAFAELTDTIRSGASIMPGAHGTSFMTLPETVNHNAKSVQALFYKGYRPDLLTVFAYLVSTGKIKLQTVTKVIYHFRLDDYGFTVERFEKADSYNKGWLISNITKLKNDDKL
ncbi:hypothetical protein [Bacteroides ilei]|mgnify:CR=1 FL=1|uniref:hypothetical protein n=1 Tax=Bacteroides ilei TaxID=1907658 RepID=UPI00092FEFC4|nr:hypothetical protein [Bacteroides ilei]